jgi:hypothetical protein
MTNEDSFSANQNTRFARLQLWMCRLSEIEKPVVYGQLFILMKRLHSGRASSGFPKVNFSMSALKRRLACIKVESLMTEEHWRMNFACTLLEVASSFRIKLVQDNWCEPVPSQEGNLMTSGNDA